MSTECLDTAMSPRQTAKFTLVCVVWFGLPHGNENFAGREQYES